MLTIAIAEAGLCARGRSYHNHFQCTSNGTKVRTRTTLSHQKRLEIQALLGCCNGADTIAIAGVVSIEDITVLEYVPVHVYHGTRVPIFYIFYIINLIFYYWYGPYR